MSVTSEVSKLAKSRVKLDIAVGNEKVRQVFDKTYRDIAAKAHVKGFRPGKVPISVIRMKYGASIARDVTENLVEEAYRDAVGQHGLRPVGQGEVISEFSPLNEESALSFTMEVDVYPECPAIEYAGLTVATIRYEVGESDVDAELARIAESRAEIEDKTEGVLEAKDFAVVDYGVFHDGEAVASLEREGYSYDLMADAGYPNFQDALLGKTTGDSFEVSATLPENFFVSDIAGKDVIFKGRIVNMQKRVLPEINDEFVAGISDKKTLVELRAYIMESMREHANAFEEERLHRSILEAIAKKTEFEIPQTMLDAQLGSLYEEAWRRTRIQSSPEEMMALAPESLREDFREKAERMVRGQVIMNEIVKNEKIEADAESINAALEGQARYYGVDTETVRKFFERNNNMSSLALKAVRNKVFDVLKKNINITVEKTLPFAEIKE
jgi:trigger factor